MKPDLDQLLRATLEEQVARARAPRVDVSRLEAKGRRRRRVRTLTTTGVVVAVVVAIVATGTTLLRGPGAPDAPVIAPGTPVVRAGATGPDAVPGPRQVFVTRTRTFLAGRALDVRLPWDTGAHVGARGVAYPQGRAHRPTLLTNDGKVVPLAPAAPVYGTTYDDWVAADSDGPLVAWSEQGPDGAQVVAFDTATSREVGRLDLPCVTLTDERSCPFPYVADGGAVFISQGSRVTVWRPGEDRRASLDGADLPSQAHHRTLTTFEGSGDVDVARIGGRWTQARSPEGGGGLLSYDGDWLLDDARGGLRVFDWREPSRSVTYRAPGTVQEASFDTDGSLLVVTEDRGRWTGWDCTPRGGCRGVVPAGQDEIRLVAWDL